MSDYESIYDLNSWTDRSGPEFYDSDLVLMGDGLSLSDFMDLAAGRLPEKKAAEIRQAAKNAVTPTATPTGGSGGGSGTTPTSPSPPKPKNDKSFLDKVKDGLETDYYGIPLYGWIGGGVGFLGLSIVLYKLFK